MEVDIEEKVVTSDPPPAYCSLFVNESCSDASRTPEAVVSEVTEEPLVGTTFLNQIARIGFIQKVLAIRFLQVFASFVIILAATSVWFSRQFVRQNKSRLMILSSLLHLATIIPLFCFKHKATIRPYNIMFLVAYPLTSTFALLVITNAYLYVSIEFCLAWYYYTIILLGQMILSLFCLHTSFEYRMRSAMLLAGTLTIVTFAFTLPWVSNFDYYWEFSIPWVCFLILLVFAECAQIQYQLSVMTSVEYQPRLTPADFITGTLYTYMIFGYNYSKYVKSFISKVCK